MSWNYEDYLTQELSKIVYDLNLDVKIEVCEEQLFAKMIAPVPNTIYCVIKYLSTNVAYNTLVRPIQVLIVSEGNQMQKARALFENFATNYNWKLVKDGTTYIKQQYSTPVVISNFNDVGYDFRSVLYMSGTLIIMENVIDVDNIQVGLYDNINNAWDYEKVEPLSFQMQYSVNGNTQQIAGSKIAHTIKETATVSVALIIAPKNSNFLKKAVDIANDDASGNIKFKITFTLDEVSFDYEMVLTSLTFTTMPGDAPAITLSFMR